MNTEITASFDFLQTGPPTWEIEITTADGRLLLVDGGSRLLIDGRELHVGPNREYASLYSHFAGLIEEGQSDVDAEPLRLVAEALRLGRRTSVPVTVCYSQAR